MIEDNKSLIDSFLAAMEIIAHSTQSQTTSTQLMTIISVPNQGEYKYKVKKDEVEREALAGNGAVYKKDDQVYVIVPESDKDIATIISAYGSEEMTTLVDPLNLYQVVGNGHIISGAGDFILTENKTQILYSAIDKGNNLIEIDQNLFKTYIYSGSGLKISSKFTVNLPQAFFGANSYEKCTYGLRVHLNFGETDKRIYELGINQIEGYPYILNNKDAAVFYQLSKEDIDKLCNEESPIEQIDFYVANLPVTLGAGEGFSVSDIQLYSQLLKTNIEDETFLILTPNGLEVSNKTINLEAVLQSKDQIMTDTVAYKWYKKQKNDYQELVGQTGAILQVAAADVLRSSVEFKCEVVYKTKDEAGIIGTAKKKSDTIIVKNGNGISEIKVTANRQEENIDYYTLNVETNPTLDDVTYIWHDEVVGNSREIDATKISIQQTYTCDAYLGTEYLGTGNIIVDQLVYSISKVENYYQATKIDTDTELDSDQWKTSPSETEYSETYKYLWNYEIIYGKALEKEKIINQTNPSVIAAWGKEGTSPYTISLNNDADIIAQSTTGVIVSTLPIVQASAYIGSSQQNTTLSCTPPENWILNTNYTFENNTLEILKIPNGFKEGEFIIKWGSIAEKRFSLKVIPSEVDYDLIISKPVINNSYTSGIDTFPVTVRKKSIDGINILNKPTDDTDIHLYIGTVEQVDWSIEYTSATTAIELILKDSKDIIWDRETIEFVKDGAPGTEKYTISLDEDFIAVPTDAEGIIKSWFDFDVITPTIYLGENILNDWDAEQKTDTNNLLYVTISAPGNAVSWNNKQVNIDKAKLIFTNNKAYIDFKLYSYDNNTLRATSRVEIIKSPAGVNGAYVYALADSGSLKLVDGIYSPSSTSISIYRRTGDTEPVLESNKSYWYKVFKDNNSTAISSSPTEVSDGDFTVSTSSSFKPTQKIRVVLYSDAACTTVVDKVTIDIVKDGENGISPYTMDLNNDMDSVPADHTGVVPDGGLSGASTELQVLYGITPQSLTTSNCRLSTATKNLLNEDYYSFTIDNKKAIFSLNSYPASLPDVLPIVFEYSPGAFGTGAAVYSKTFSITKIRSEEGQEPIDFYLELSSTAVNTTNKGGTITITAKKKIGTTIENATSEDDQIAIFKEGSSSSVGGNSYLQSYTIGQTGEITFILKKKVEDTWIVWDRETLLLNKDGKDATAALGISLTNDSDLVPASSSGVVNSSTALGGASTIAKAFLNGQEQADANIACSAKAKSGNTVYNLTLGSHYTYSNNTFTLTTWNNTQNWDNVIATFTYEATVNEVQQSISKDFVITKMPAEKGENAVDYDLLLTPQVVNLSENSEPIIVVQVIKIDGQNQTNYTATAIANGKLKYYFNGDSEANVPTAQTISWKAGKTSLKVRYYFTSTLFEEEEVTSIRNGVDGKDGVDGSDGTDGIDAKDFNITASSYVLSKDKQGVYKENIILTAHLLNIDGTVKWYKNSVELGSGDFYEIQAAGISNQDLSGTYTAKINNTNWEDSVTIGTIVDGPKGDDGADAIAIVLSNPNVTFHAGTSSEEETCQVIVYEGGNTLSYSQTSQKSCFRISNANNCTVDEAGVIYIKDKVIDGTATFTVTIYSADGIPTVHNLSIPYKIIHDGTGVTIKGTAYVASNTIIDDSSIGKNYLLYKDANCTTQIVNPEDNDSYIVNGYLFVYSGAGNDFTCVGKIRGPEGESGRGVSNVINYYMASARKSGVVAGKDGEDLDKNEEWTTSIQTVTEEKQYLWNYEVILYTTNNESTVTDPAIIGNYSKDGKGIAAIQEYYCIKSSTTCTKPSEDILNSAGAAGDNAQPDTWYTTTPLTNLTYKYLWNCEKITYTDGPSSIMEPALIGTHGEKGSTVEVVYAYRLHGSSSVPDDKPTDGQAPTGNWTLKPSGVTVSSPYEFVSQNTVTDGVYGKWSEPKVWAKYGSDASVTRENTFNALTNGGNNQGIYYGDGTGAPVGPNDAGAQLYINASMIKTGALKVENEKKTVFSADVDNDTVLIGGFEVTATGENSGYIARGQSSYLGTGQGGAGVYLGTNGIGLGNGAFYVKSDGNAKFKGAIEATSLTITPDVAATAGLSTQSYANSQADAAKTAAINTASSDATEKANNAKADAISTVEGKGYQTSSQVTQITKDTVTSTYIQGLKLKVGDEIEMGSNAKISWKNVTEKDEVATTTDVGNAQAAAVKEVKDLGYQTSSQVKTEISESKIRTDQIEVTDLNAFGATIAEWQITSDGIVSPDGTFGLWNNNTGKTATSLVDYRQSAIRMSAGVQLTTRHERVIVEGIPYVEDSSANPIELPLSYPCVEIKNIIPYDDEFYIEASVIDPTDNKKIQLDYQYMVEDGTVEFDVSYLSYDYDNASFKFLEDGSIYASAIKIEGKADILASGSLAGWDYDQQGIWTDNSSAGTGIGLWSTTNHANIAIHAGATTQNIGSAPFRVYHDGSVNITKGSIEIGTPPANSGADPNYACFSIDSNGIIRLNLNQYEHADGYNEGFMVYTNKHTSSATGDGWHYAQTITDPTDSDNRSIDLVYDIDATKTGSQLHLTLKKMRLYFVQGIFCGYSLNAAPDEDKYVTL